MERYVNNILGSIKVIDVFSNLVIEDNTNFYFSFYTNTVLNFTYENIENFKNGLDYLENHVKENKVTQGIRAIFTDLCRFISKNRENENYLIGNEKSIFNKIEKIYYIINEKSVDSEDASDNNIWKDNLIEIFKMNRILEAKIETDNIQSEVNGIGV